MRLVEVVVLMGAHCISPVEHAQTQMNTDAVKVQCAVVIEKDTDKGTLKVTPETMSGDPRVIAAITRFDEKAGATKIVPAFAPAGSPATVIKPPPPLAAAAVPTLPAMLDQPPPAAGGLAPGPAAPPAVQQNPENADTTAESKAEAEPAASKAVAAEPAEQPAKPVKPQPARKAKPERKKQVAVAEERATKGSSQCKGSAVAKWYTNAEGRRKYRCVRPEPAGGKPPGTRMPAQIY